MAHLNYIIKFLLLASITFIPAHSQPETEQANNERPIWSGMNPGSDNSGNTEQGFVEPPPTNKLTAKIIASNAVIKKGETVSFTIESNQSNLKYYWISGDQKSTTSNFVINTSSLDTGKYRVRATITNEQRVQAHASTFFTVVDSTANTETPDATNTTATSNTDSVIELPAPQPSTEEVDQSTEKTSSNVDAENQQDEGKVGELPVPDTEKPTVASEQTDSADSTGNEDRLIINPERLIIELDETAAFSTPAKEGYSYQWKFTDKRGNNDHFEIVPSALVPGSYLVHLTATDQNNVQTKAQATLVIRKKSAETIPVPNLIGKRIDDAKAILAEQNLQLGNVHERDGDTGQGVTVLEQTPKAGIEIKASNVIDVVVGVSAAIQTPDLLGRKLKDAEQLITQSGFSIGKVTLKIDDNAINQVIGQNPRSSANLAKGSSIDLVIGKATPKPLVVNIHPTTTVIELGGLVELAAIIVDPELDNGLVYSWQLGKLNGKNKVFKIDTKELALGEHDVELNVTDSDGRETTSKAVVKVTQKTVQAPDLLGKNTDVANDLLVKAGLKLGKIKQKPSDVINELILEQSPSAGEKVAIGSEVQLLVATPKPVEQTTAELSVDDDNVKVGESITFTTALEPTPEDNDIHYVYSINAEKKANVQPQLEWTPNKEGIYSVAVTVFSESGILAKSSPLTITVSPSWELPVAKVLPEMLVVKQGDKAEFVSTSTYDLNSALNYEWSSDTEHGGSKKQFAFDTSETAPGSYSVRLNVVDDKKNESSISAMLVVQAAVDSTTANISNGVNGAGHKGVDNTKNDEGDLKPDIHLSTTRRFVSTNTPIRIKAISDSDLSTAYYYFEPGDENKKEWIAENEIKHTYKSFGTYLVRAAVKNEDKVYYSNSITIWVWSPLLLIFTFGIGLLAFIVMWWWTKRIPAAAKTEPRNHKKVQNRKKPPAQAVTKPKLEVVEEQIPLRSDKNDIVTETRLAKKDERTVMSVLKRALLQFLLGIAISVLVIYIILKSANLL